jgi:hypothetical protein
MLVVVNGPDFVFIYKTTIIQCITQWPRFPFVLSKTKQAVHEEWDRLTAIRFQ